MTKSSSTTSRQLRNRFRISSCMTGNGSYYPRTNHTILLSLVETKLIDPITSSIHEFFCTISPHEYQKVRTDERSKDSTGEGLPTTFTERIPPISLRNYVSFAIYSLLFLSLLYFLYAAYASLFPPLPTLVIRPLNICPSSAPEYEKYKAQHHLLVENMIKDCPSVWNENNGLGPRLLVSECTAGWVCSGWGDRAAKIAGLFEFALISNRSYFIHHSKPDVEDWFSPVDIDWRYQGKVAECLEWGYKTRHDHKLTYWDVNYFGYYGGTWAWLRRNVFLKRGKDAALTYIELPNLWVDGIANILRPLQIEGEFPADAYDSPLIPHPLVTDDTRSSLLTGCLLNRLFTFNANSNELVTPLLSVIKEENSDCLVAAHIRFGDVFMFHFENHTSEGSETDRHIEPTPEVVHTTLQCALSTAYQVCPSQEKGKKRGELFIFVATDTPSKLPWFHEYIPTLKQLDSVQQRQQQHTSTAFSNIKIINSAWGTPGNVLSFHILPEEERIMAEKQLVSDWEMFAKARAVITTGSVLSYTGASMGLTNPIDANTCQIDR